VPVGFTTFSDGLRAGVEVFHNLKKVLSDKGLATAVGDEGGFAPALETNESALGVIMTAIEKAGYKPGEQIRIALDCAATEYFDAKTNLYDLDGKKVDGGGVIDILSQWISKYPICSIEDG